MRHKLLMLFASLFSFSASQGAEVTSGSLTTIKTFKSKYIAPRSVHIWLPNQYQSLIKKGAKLDVLYMHDGQMLFDAKTTWNEQEWGVDEVASKLIDEGAVRPFIVVGIDNGGPLLRRAEYFPQKPFMSLDDRKQAQLYEDLDGDGELLFGGNKVQSDDYLKFLVEELKPYIDARYSVKTSPEHTFIMGSSMGGLISMYAISEYPDTYSAAACMSTHWPGDHDRGARTIPEAFFAYMREHLASPKKHRLYFDHGTDTLDAWYPPLERDAEKLIHELGYDHSNFQMLEFDGADHTENAWKARLHIPLLFLLGIEDSSRVATK